MTQNNNDGTNNVTGFGNGMILRAKGLGQDIFTGGCTNETFALGNNSGHDPIKDFVGQGVGQDLIKRRHMLVSSFGFV